MTQTEQQQKAFTVGDLVTPKDLYAPKHLLGRGYRVVKVNPKNLVCEALDGGRGISFPPYALMPYDPDTAPKATVVPVAMPLAEGTVVTLKRPFKHWTTTMPMVVTKDDGRGKVNVCRMFGADGGRYVRIPAGGLVVRDAAWLKEAL